VWGADAATIAKLDAAFPDVWKSGKRSVEPYPAGGLARPLTTIGGRHGLTGQNGIRHATTAPLVTPAHPLGLDEWDQPNPRSAFLKWLPSTPVNW
jgi:hypothetical protein